VISSRPGPARLGIVGAAVVCVSLAAVVGACSGGDDDTTPTTTTTQAATTTTTGIPVDAEATGLRDLEVGQCFELPRDDPGAEDRAVWVLSCTDPHTHEVYAVLTYDGTAPKGGAYPGATVVQDWAEQSCYAGFEAFVGEAWTASDFDIETWWPSAESWARRDRTVICTTYPSSGGRTTGTARGSGA